MSSPLSPTGLAENIIGVLRSQPVVLAYLFGSYARGAADSESDLDIAILVDASLSKEARFDLRLRLQRSIAEALGHDLEAIDVVILQDVPSLLQYNVIRTGRLLFASNEAMRHGFELGVETAYEDEAPYLERETATTLTRILAHQL